MIKNVRCQCMLLFIQISTHNQEQSYTIGSYHLLLAQNNTWQTVNVQAFCMGLGNILMYNYTIQYISWFKTINFSVNLSNFYFIFYMLSLMIIQSDWNIYIEYTTYSLTQSPFLTCPSSKYLKTIMLSVVFQLHIVCAVCIEEWRITCSDLCRNLTLFDSISNCKQNTDHLTGTGGGCAYFWHFL